MSTSQSALFLLLGLFHTHKALIPQRESGDAQPSTGGRGETPNKGWTQLLVLAEGSGDFHLANFGHPAAATPPGALASVDVAAQPYMWYTYLAHEEEPLWIVHSEGAPRPATVPRLEDP